MLARFVQSNYTSSHREQFVRIVYLIKYKKVHTTIVQRKGTGVLLAFSVTMKYGNNTLLYIIVLLPDLPDRAHPCAIHIIITLIIKIHTFFWWCYWSD